MLFVIQISVGSVSCDITAVLFQISVSNMSWRYVHYFETAALKRDQVVGDDASHQGKIDIISVDE